ncbi:hypothetical protein EYW49_03450 [Siculibacillus lacustris]|uniref:Uncharacterized protein n=1 Tax=Siculibacillus lacustris TaxID=1549641 RepID=A0A4Q9VXX5_9HYPH|nr:hypothetical protein [Siculibacillus lacustris]TBW40794.1 hypothetical protein EYW49_03450 [Siculibacillus lacustris]
MRLVSFLPSRSSRWPALAAALLCAVLGAPAALATDSPPPASGAVAAPQPTDQFLDMLASRPGPHAAADLRTRIAALWGLSGSDTADLLSARAATLLRAGDAGTAFDLLDAAVTVAPDWAEGRRRRAMMRLMRGDVDRARLDLEAAVRSEPRQFPAMITLAMLAEQRGDRVAALAWARRAAAVDPSDAALAEHIRVMAIEVEGREI